MATSFVALVREKFAFLENPQKGDSPGVSGFFEYLPQSETNWEDFCGYWTTQFVLTFNWDRRESLLILSLRRNYSIFSPCYKDADVVSLSSMIKLVEPQWINPTQQAAATIDDVIRMLDTYAKALHEHCAPILSPLADERYRLYDTAKSLPDGLHASL